MKKLSLSAAAKATGKSKSTISKALNSGRLSGSRNGKQWEIDAAELFRVYERRTDTKRTEATEREPSEELLKMEIKILREQLEREREAVNDMRDRLDAESAERRKLTTLLTDQRDAAKQRPWWKIFGR